MTFYHIFLQKARDKDMEVVYSSKKRWGTFYIHKQVVLKEKMKQILDLIHFFLTLQINLFTFPAFGHISLYSVSLYLIQFYSHVKFLVDITRYNKSINLNLNVQRNVAEMTLLNMFVTCRLIIISCCKKELLRYESTMLSQSM